MTLLVASVFVDDLAELERRAQEAWTSGADAVEIRLDTYKDDPADLAEHLSRHPECTWIVTCRGAAEGGRSTGDASQRASLLVAAAGGTDAYVDFELAEWERSSDVRQKVLQAAARPKGNGHRLILSAHDFGGVPADLRAIVEKMSRAKPPAVAKIAYRAADISDSFAALDLQHQHGSATASICMGEEGLWSRVLAKKLGAFATYCTLTADSPTAPGQITLDDMVNLYRWHAMDSSTQVFGVLGDPVAHSMSPLLFNRWFAEANINAVYLPLRVRNDGDSLTRFLNGCVDRPWLDVTGLSVTLPHKVAALRWLGGEADRAARSIGAVNTLVFRGDQRAGYNTDCPAAVGSLIDALGCSRGDLAGLPVDVLGTGGAARAVLAGLRDLGCAVTVYGRSAEKTLELAHTFGCRPAGWEDRTARAGEVLVNATSVGMGPQAFASPMPPESLTGCRLVFDLIYNPLETRLLDDAKTAGATVLSGLDMFVRQAAMQFELWTDKTPDTRLAKELITQRVRSTGEHAHPSACDSHADKPCIALIGYRGCGKTVVGRVLADLIGGDHVDTDECVVEHAGRSIAEIFQTEGEAGFRRREAEVIARVVASTPAVISVGGGAILDDQNAASLRKVATVVLLTAPPEVLQQRIGADPASAASRPTLTALGECDEVRRLLAERLPRYRRVADLTIDTSNKEPHRVAGEIAERLKRVPQG